MTKGKNFPRCATCKHWDEEPYTGGLGVRRCMRIPQWWVATEWDEKEVRRFKTEMAGTLAFATDASSYAAALLTLADFGCVMHEEA